MTQVFPTHQSKSMPASGELQVSPLLLKFPFELKKQISSVMCLSNESLTDSAFKVKTTAPKKYCVRPNTGYVKAGQTIEVQVTMQAQKEWPADFDMCRDKFLVQSVAVKDTLQPINGEMVRVHCGILRCVSRRCVHRSLLLHGSSILQTKTTFSRQSSRLRTSQSRGQKHCMRA